ncbi:hypothetical protein M378DRAFT_170083 [Amanita muscaria Koide BX008]|uniref:Uncharacterized protein n=1 Tax=Amanita muscaria (strain Koide BX008) TaxID=946122 RepID=A0A0C2SXM8_AMAMK|nr:hypothetical protein M378DRAFT_170083 [Amanita muscaria Koide BX008]
MSVARTTRGISKIPGVSTFRSAYQPPVPELRVVSLDPCGKCRKEFKPLSDTPWDEVIQDVVEHVRLCERVTKELDQSKRHGRKTDEEKKRDERAKKRRTVFQQDPWAALVEPTQVRCGACGTLIQLDKRRKFYPGLWNNHRARCPGIDRIFNRAERVVVAFQTSSGCEH